MSFALYIATPQKHLTPAEFTTRKSDRQTTYNYIYLPPTVFPRLKGPGEANEIAKKNIAYISTTSTSTSMKNTLEKRTSKSSSTRSKGSIYKGGILGSRNASYANPFTYFVIALIVIGVLIILIIAGTVFYWSRCVMNGCLIENEAQTLR